MFSPLVKLVKPFLLKNGIVKSKKLLTGLIGILFLNEPINAQTANLTKNGKGLQFISADSSFSVKINARIQALYSGTYYLEEKDYADEMQIRRARLNFSGFTFSPRVKYQIELALSNADIRGRIEEETSNTANVVLDAFVSYELIKNLSLWFGQTKLPGNRERVISSQKLQFVDRSLLNDSYNIDRDLGGQVHHQFTWGKVVFREIVAVSMGEGRNITTTNRGGYDYTGRVEVLPLGKFIDDGDYSGSDIEREKTPKLAIGVSYDFNHQASREGGQLGSFFSEQRDLKTLFADAMFKYRGLSCMTEYARKKAGGSPIVEIDETGRVTKSFFTGTGFNWQAGYLFKNNFELAARYTQINPENLTGRDKNKQYTLAVSKYLMGHTVKIQSDVSLLKEQTNFEELMYRFQVEFGF